MDGQKSGRRSVLWHGLCRGTSWLYARLFRSGLGRLMTAYRTVDGRPVGRKYCVGQYHCRPVSQGRLRVADAMDRALLVRLLRAMVHGLYVCPLRIYGLFLFFSGAFHAGSYLVLTYLELLAHYPIPQPGHGHLVAASILVLVSLPLMISRSRLDEGLARSGLTRLIFGKLLGVPLEKTRPPRKKAPKWLAFAAILMALGATVAVLYISPATMALVLLAVGITGMIFSYPETGAVLSTLLLPGIWINDKVLYLLLGVILLTWGGYACQVLLLRRTVRFGCMDMVVLLFGGVILLAGFVGSAVSLDGMLQSVILFICLSDYFLIVNLMTTRADITRCIFGLGLSSVTVTVIGYLQQIPAHELDWLSGSRAGDAIVVLFQNGIAPAGGMWGREAALLLVLLLPLFYSGVVRAKRLLPRALLLLLVAADLWLLWMNRAVVALFCAAAVTLIYFLLSGSKGLASALVLLPVVGCGLFWLTLYANPIMDTMSAALSSIRYEREVAVSGLWDTVFRYPAGYGVGAVADSGNLFFELLHSFGWQGLILAVATVFLFIQKSLTALAYSIMPQDRGVVIATMTAVGGVLIYGALHPLILSSGIFVTLTVLLAVCSAYENILFDESDIRMAESMYAEHGVDRMLRTR